jgi:hypothetical protein
VECERNVGQPGEVAASSASLPVSRSFVVQLSGDTAPGERRFRGRVEHIDSGRSQRFESIDDLITFLSEVLAGRDAE